jgi:transmembrane sensor
MKRSDHEDLFKRYQSGEATPEEQAIVEDYILNNELNPLYLSEAELEEMTARLGEKISKIPFGERPAVPLYRRWKIAVAAAAAVAAITLGTWLYMNGPDVKSGDVVVNDIAPGRNGATITLASGKVIQLSDAKSGVVVGEGDLKYDDGSSVLSSRANAKDLDSSELGMTNLKGVTLTASTAKGQTYQFTLPDGTKVWLNADSKLEFPSNFVNSKTRNVKLSGEGYFEVAKDKAHPFIVATDKQEVEVLGTHFNINSYADKGSVRTTLLEGSVRVAIGNSSTLSGRSPSLPEGERSSIVLKPNQQSVLTGSNRIKVTDVDTELAVAWKEGFFKFNEERLDEIMTKVSRWYDVEISYADPTLKGKTFNGTVSRFSNVSQLLKKLELTGAVHFKIEGRRIVVDR